MDGCNIGWDGWSAEQWLEEAGRFEKMAERFSHHPQLNASFRALARDATVRAKDGQLTEARVVQDADWRHAQQTPPTARPASRDVEYLRRRAAQEQTAALQSRDLRVRRVHFEMAELYCSLINRAEAGSGAELRLVS